MSNRAFLRKATREAHMAAEAVWVGETGFESRRRYEQWLRALRRAHAELGEAAAISLGGGAFLVTERQRIQALDMDLSRARRCEYTPRALADGGYSWGVLYALNGSALGAASLLKSGAAPSQWPRSYLTLLRDFATSGQLLAFFRSLDEADLDLAAAIAGAEAVFAAVKGGATDLAA